MAKAATKSRSTGEISSATRVILLHGDDRFRQEAALEEIRAALVEAHGEDGFDTVRFDGAAPASLSGGNMVAEILDECRTMGLMIRHKLVLVENAEVLLKGGSEEEGEAPPPARGAKARGRSAGPQPKTNRELFQAYAADPSDSATLVLRANRWHPGKLDDAVRDLGKRGAVLRLDAMKPAEAAAWVRNRSQARHGVPIAPDAAQALVASAGTELGRLDMELAKLAVVNPGKPITLQAVAQFVGFSREEDFWKIQDSLLSGNAAESLQRLRDLVEVSRHQAVPLAWAYTDLARKVYGASIGMAAGEPPGAISKRLKLWGPAGDAILSAGRRIPPRRAAALLRAAVDNDVKLKSSHGDPIRNLETLTLRFTSELR